MRAPFIALISFGLVACEDASLGLQALSADEQLILSAISGEEDYLTGRQTLEERPEGAAPEEAPTSAPPMFRECDAEGEYVGLFSAYDLDESGELRGEESETVQAEHGGGPGGPRDHLMRLLGLVYDSDGEMGFSEAEKATLLSDFSARCEAIHAQILADFDADGDGTLSEAEEAEARAAHEAEMEAQREAMESCRPLGEGEGAREGGEGRPAAGERGEGPPPEGEGARGEGGEPPAGPPPAKGPLGEEFDADGDGLFSEAELATLRETIRARISSGAHPEPACEEGA